MSSTRRGDRTRQRWLGAATAAGLLVVGAVDQAAAHADADAVAAATGSEITITFRPNHGCGPSPTVEVAIQIPVPGAKAEAVEGWEESSTPDGSDKTVVEWTGGSLPTTETGSFPVTLTLPDRVGEMVTFPAVQICENGEELSWLNGDLESDYPVPRILVLPPGSPTALTAEDVPADAPGRELLDAVIPPSSTTNSPSTTSDEGATTTTPVLVERDDAPATIGEDTGFNSRPLVTAAVALVVTLSGGLLLSRFSKR